jgi:hypothetical protein
MTKPTLRKPVGMLGILGWITIWCIAMLFIAPFALASAWPVQLIFFAIAGTVWIIPLKPALRWMETGRWRE